MLNFNRRDRSSDAKDSDKSVLRPAIYDPPGSLAKPTGGIATRPSSLASTPDSPVAASASPRDGAAQTLALASGIAIPETQPSAAAGSKLFVGVNIKLKGVEISDCDHLVIEGHVEATVHSKGMQIAKPGTLKGTALIDVAEVHGEFSGEMTARTRLVVHGTGRVSGTIRYGKLVVAEGGELSGDVKRLDASVEDASVEHVQPSRNPVTGSRHVLAPAIEIGPH